jgi:hypothetical protein
MVIPCHFTTFIFQDIQVYKNECTHFKHFIEKLHKNVCTLSQTPCMIQQTKKKKTPWLVVRKRTIPTERPPLVSEASANFKTASNNVHITTERLQTYIPTFLQSLKTQLEISSESSFNTTFLKLII